MNERQMVILGAFAGALVGAAAGYLFFTDHGRDMRNRMEPFVDEMGQEFTRFQRTIQKVGEMATEGMRVVDEFNTARAQSNFGRGQTSH